MIEGLDVVPPDYPQEEVENIPPTQATQIPPSAPNIHTSRIQPGPPAVTHTTPKPVVQASQFVDPAILSFTRAPPPLPAVRSPVAQVSTQSPLPPNYIAPPPQIAPPPSAARPRSIGGGPTSLRAQQSVPVLRQNAAATKVVTNQSQPSVPIQPTGVASTASSVARKQFTAPHKGPALQPAFQELSLRDTVGDSSAFDETDDALSALPTPQPVFDTKRTRKGGKGRRQDQSQDFFGAAAPRSMPPGNFSGRQNRRFNRNGGHYHNGNHNGHGEEEGWATEDINDIRDTEFDFQGNLDRFDKKTVFSQIKVCSDSFEKSFSY